MSRAAGIITLSIASAALAVALAAASAATVSPDKPIPAEVYVKSAGKATPLRGSLVKFDDSVFTLRVAGEDRTLAWTDVTPATAFTLRQKTIDRTHADQCLALGKFGWSIGAKEQAQGALRSAVRIDASLKTQVDAVLATAPGSAVPAATQPADGKELMTEGAGPAPKTTAKPGDKSPDVHVKYQPSTPEQAAEAMKRTRKQAAEVEEKIGVKLAEFETDHFIVFTDWDKRENDFLKTNLEGAYRVVATQFEMDPKDNVFVGKLPVYMLARYSDFASFAREIDQFPDVNNRTAGYYMGNTKGFGHMAMWKPNESLTGTSSLDDARKLWAYVLVHEFTHAFLARYRSNEFIPRWLNEGVAEVIAYHQFPMANRHRMARMIAQNKQIDIAFLFDDAGTRPTGEFYPVMQSMVELLVSQNKQGFLKMIDAIKDGTSPEKALQDNYNADYVRFAAIWREWAKKQPDQ